MQQEDLERVIDIKVRPLLDKAMHTYLGITVAEIESDISDKLKHNPFFGFEIVTSLPFKKAKKLFLKQYLARTCKLHFGNVSEIAATAGMNRRSIHRLIKAFKINVNECRTDKTKTYNKQGYVEDIIKDVITPYKTSINPTKFKALYKQTPTLSNDIVRALPDIELDLDKAEQEFEKRYLSKALQENNNNISQTARNIGLRFETLHRKLKRLGLLPHENI